VEPIEPVYSDIKIIISTVIFIIISLSNSIEIPAQGDIIIRPIIYSNLSTNKKAEFQEKHNRFRILEKDYNKKIDILVTELEELEVQLGA
jgi:hypothetical protein